MDIQKSDRFRLICQRMHVRLALYVSPLNGSKQTAVGNHAHDHLFLKRHQILGKSRDQSLWIWKDIAVS